MINGEYIVSPLAAWATAEVLKTITYTIKNRRFDISRLVGDGGMPSAHSATVSALAMTCLLCFGFTSIQFAISGVLALVVMHDASGIRLESSKQAKAINELFEELQHLVNMPRKERLEELLGHTPLQVLMGAITGIAVATIVHFI